MTNSQMHKITTRQTFVSYIPTPNLTIYQKCVYYQEIKIYNHLPKKKLKIYLIIKINLN